MLVSRMRENLTSGSLGGRWRRGLTEMEADLSTGGKPPREMRGHPSSGDYRASVLPGFRVAFGLKRVAGSKDGPTNKAGRGTVDGIC